VAGTGNATISVKNDVTFNSNVNGKGGVGIEYGGSCNASGDVARDPTPGFAMESNEEFFGRFFTDGDGHALSKDLLVSSAENLVSFDPASYTGKNGELTKEGMNALRAAANEALAEGKILYIAGDLKLPNNEAMILGSEEQQLMVIIDGDLSSGRQLDLYGFLYVDGDFNKGAQMNVHGGSGLAITGSMHGGGQVDVVGVNGPREVVTVVTEVTTTVEVLHIKVADLLKNDDPNGCGELSIVEGSLKLGSAGILGEDVGRYFTLEYVYDGDGKIIEIIIVPAALFSYDDLPKGWEQDLQFTYKVAGDLYPDMESNETTVSVNYDLSGIDSGIDQSSFGSDTPDDGVTAAALSSAFDDDRDGLAVEGDNKLTGTLDEEALEATPTGDMPDIAIADILSLHFEDLLSRHGEEAQAAFTDMLDNGKWHEDEEGGGATFIAMGECDNECGSSIHLSVAETLVTLKVVCHHEDQQYAKNVEVQNFDIGKFHQVDALDHAAATQIVQEIVKVGGGA